MTKSKAEQAAPKTTDAAIALLEIYAVNAGLLATIEANRASALASTNTVADGLAAPLLEHQAEIRAQLEPWWAKQGAALTRGKRKSIELGGCMIGSKMGRPSLAHAFADDAAAVAALQGERWSKPYVRVSYGIDRTATLKAIAAPTTHAAKLTALGFDISPGVETFYVERVAQVGTLVTQ